jgi:hypothetical protein
MYLAVLEVSHSLFTQYCNFFGVVMFALSSVYFFDRLGLVNILTCRPGQTPGTGRTACGIAPPSAMVNGGLRFRKRYCRCRRKITDITQSALPGGGTFPQIAKEINLNPPASPIPPLAAG